MFCGGMQRSQQIITLKFKFCWTCVSVLGNTEEDYVLPEIGKRRIDRADALYPSRSVAFPFWEKGDVHDG